MLHGRLLWAKALMGIAAAAAFGGLTGCEKTAPETNVDQPKMTVQATRRPATARPNPRKSGTGESEARAQTAGKTSTQLPASPGDQSSTSTALSDEPTTAAVPGPVREAIADARKQVLVISGRPDDGSPLAGRLQALKGVVDNLNGFLASAGGLTDAQRATASLLATKKIADWDEAEQVNSFEQLRQFGQQLDEALAGLERQMSVK
jgi:hypothetical protein